MSLLSLLQTHSCVNIYATLYDSYFQIDRPLAKKLHKAEPERTTCGPEYFMMRVRTALDPTLAASPITAEDAKLEVRICPPKSAPRDFSREGPIDLKVAGITSSSLSWPR